MINHLQRKIKLSTTCTNRFPSYLIFRQITTWNLKSIESHANWCHFFNRGVLLTFIRFLWLKSKTIYTLTLQIVTKTNKQKQMSLTAVVDKGKIEKQIKMKPQECTCVIGTKGVTLWQPNVRHTFSTSFLRKIGLKCSYSWYTICTQSFISANSFLFHTLPYISRSINILKQDNHKII